MLDNSSSSEALINSGDSNRRKRRPAGTPDPDAEVVSLSPKTLLESDRYICEICNQGFQRDQNLQMHRRRHKVPWKLVKRENPQVKKRVFVCPEPSCLHHDPCHALGDLVGIKKHFRRKHSDNKQWICDKCGKGYAVQSDYKAHLKTCGTRGHSCDCGRVFSRWNIPEFQDSFSSFLTTAYAEEARRNAKREMEYAEREFENAKRIRQQAQGEIERAKKLKEEAIKRISSSILEITCHACKNKFQQNAPIDNVDQSSPPMSYMSSATTDGEREQ
ncbi:hypothetical protein KY284_003807 [Solanum tuberosum]|nr:hypothetical protein KY284_003807 [Solanum tuberosum]